MKVGPKFKICRRVGDRVFGKCQTTKFTISGVEKKRKATKHPKGAPSEYASQLIEKQKAKYTYGVTERQFAKYIKGVKSHHGSNRRLGLFKTLENRLDNVVFRMGLASTRTQARQLVAHGHILVNDRKIRVPSYEVKVGNVVKIRPESRNKTIFNSLSERLKNYTSPEWLIFDLDKNEGVIKGEPVLGKAESTIDFESILEFYSR